MSKPPWPLLVVTQMGDISNYFVGLLKNYSISRYAASLREGIEPVMAGRAGRDGRARAGVEPVIERLSP